MRFFPVTEEPVWGRPQTWDDIAGWHTRMRFTHRKDTEQEVIPEFQHLEATLQLKGAPGEYLLDFPGGKERIRLASHSGTFDVSALMCKGKHLYRVTGPEEAHFEAEVTVDLQRPLVEVTDESIVVDWSTIGEGERQQMVGSRGAHRVGRWSCWVTARLSDYAQTEVQDQIHLDATWRFHPPLDAYWADCSGLNFDDRGWEAISLPHRWDAGRDGTDGYAWYRHEVIVPADWQGQTIVVRCEGVDDEALVYVNGHEVGFCEGSRRPFQFEASGQLRYGQTNVIAFRVQKHGGESGGICGAVSLATLKRYGISFANRIYPASEDGVEVNVFAAAGERLAPIGFGPKTEFAYRPPLLKFRSLESESGCVQALNAVVDPDEDCVIYQLHPDVGMRCVVHMRFTATGLRSSQVSARNAGAGKIAVEGDAGTVVVSVPGAIGWTVLRDWVPGSPVTFDQPVHTDAAESIDLLVSYDATSADGAAAIEFSVASEAGTREATLSEAADRWEEQVYQVARPVCMDDLESAALRVYKQTVTLNARYVEEDRYHGLLADFDKPVFVVYWMRDCCLSVPGAIYTGGVARQTALANVGDTLDRYAEFPEVTGLYPDGGQRGGTFSDGPALGIAAQHYAWSLVGEDWLDKHFAGTREFVNYLIGLDSEDGDPEDGFIRCSRGDWKDVGSMDTIKRAGAVFFVNVCYLRALRYAADMAEACGERALAEEWRSLRAKGIETLNRPVLEGGLWMPEHGYYAEWVQVLGREGWVYPRDVEQVTVFSAFASVAHGMALTEGVIPEDRAALVRKRVREFGLTDPLPAPAQFPFYDIFAELGSLLLPEAHPRSNPWLLSKRLKTGKDGITPEMRLPWKGWPGNHVWGGRWPLAGGWLTLGLWNGGDWELARRSRRALERSLLRVRHPGRCYEVESFSAISREETGAHIDPAGYYQLWSGALPLQAIVEGAYGACATPDGARLDVRRCRVGDGLSRLPVLDGEISYTRVTHDTVEVVIDTQGPGELAIVLPWSAVRVDGVSGDRLKISENEIRISYGGAERIMIASA